MNFIKHKLGYFFTALSILCNLILYWSGFYDSLEQNLYDYKFRLRGPLSGDYVKKTDNFNPRHKCPDPSERTLKDILCKE